MKDKYISKVLKFIQAPRYRKQEIARDLNEAFSSAVEHGETCEQVIERLGPAEEYAKNICSELGLPLKKGTTWFLITGLCLLVGGVILIALYAFITPLIMEPNASLSIIGGADGPTQVYVSSPTDITVTMLLLILGVAAVIISVIFIIKYVRSRK